MLTSLTPALKRGAKVVTNAGGMNPRGCAAAAAKRITPQLDWAVRESPRCGGTISCRVWTSSCTKAVRSPSRYRRAARGDDAAQGLSRVALRRQRSVLARADRTGARGRRRIVITRRVADASLTVTPAAASFWLGVARLESTRRGERRWACHLSAAQATGGYF